MNEVWQSFMLSLSWLEAEVHTPQEVLLGLTARLAQEQGMVRKN